jgi:DNA-binding transcriptional ArsR family regulator
MFDDRRTMMGVNEMGIEVTQTELFAPATALAMPVDVPVESLPHPPAGEIELAAVLHALSDPMRLRIVAGLAAGHPRPCGSFELPVTKSTCTHHFKVLREAGVIRQRLEGTTRLNSLRRDDLEQRFPGLIDSVLRAAADA